LYTKYCSQKCMGKGRQVGEDRKCLTCGKLFHIRPARVRGNRGFYCSRRCIKNLQDTAIELTVKRFLDNIGLPYRSQFRLSRFTCDFAYPEIRLIIETDGTYWHSIPSGIRRDRNKARYCKKHGWTLLRFSEDTVNKTPELCLQQIREKLGIYLYCKSIDRTPIAYCSNQ
jgi:very-short-patch-repair endonuclease